MRTWLKASGWKRTQSSSVTVEKLDALGESIELLSSYCTNPKLEDLQVLIAIGAECTDKREVLVETIISKLPGIDKKQVASSLKELQGAKMSSSNSPLIDIKKSSDASGEKISLTSFGMQILNRVLQRLSPPRSTDAVKPAIGGGENEFTPVIEGIGINGENIHIPSSFTIITGASSTGKVDLLMTSLARQAIEQGAFTYWLTETSEPRVSWALYGIADRTCRSHAFYVNGNYSYMDEALEEVFIQDGICIDIIDKSKGASIKSRLADLVEMTKKLEHLERSCLVVIDADDAIGQLDREDLVNIEILQKARFNIIISNEWSDPSSYQILREEFGFNHLLMPTAAEKLSALVGDLVEQDDVYEIGKYPGRALLLSGSPSSGIDSSPTMLELKVESPTMPEKMRLSNKKMETPLKVVNC
ncbi:hypothetical protein [Microbulbifer epialgicus]|uniref:AAA domain-containing protein n=1 Tax=Microbulbifer epialgicus TaxID=393907 RepID=A0ABV4NTB2_9GAMM